MISVPYQFQRDNHGGNGHRECFSSSVAMLCIRLGVVRSDDAYISVRKKYGDTTSSMAHIQAVKELGLIPSYSQTWSRATLEASLRSGVPVAVGWLHHGHSSRPTGGGHWSVIIESTSTHVVMHDPYGEPDVLNGGHLSSKSGRAVRCTWRNWGPRWLVEGPAAGWAFTVRR